jgi:tetratricopeptide (TPR) repeat protein
MCSCRGPHAGFVHIRCLVANAGAKVIGCGEADDEAYFNALQTCVQCRQLHQGPVRVALKRAAWLRYAGRAETDKYRQTALRNLGTALNNVARHDEALVVHEESVATRRRLYGQDDIRTIEAEEKLAYVVREQGDLRRAHEMLTRCYDWKASRLGSEHENTLDAAIHMAYSYRKLGSLTDAEELYRKTLAARRRINGDNHVQTLECRHFLAQVLVDMGRVAEAREMHAGLLPVVTRVLGPDHYLARRLRQPGFFTPQRAP